MNGSQVEMVECMDKMQLMIDPERLGALQDLYESGQPRDLSLDDRVALRRALIEERREYDTSWLDADADGDVIRGKTGYLDEINLDEFQLEDLSQFHLPGHGTIEENVSQVHAEVKKNQEV